MPAMPQRLAPCLFGLAVLACAPLASPRGPAPDRDGTYRFIARHDGLTILQGAYTLDGDEVTVETTEGLCVERPRFGNESRFTGRSFSCGEVTLNVDLIDPMRSSTISFEEKYTKSTTVCVEYATGTDGRRTCVRRETRTSDAYRLASVRLRGVRVPEVPPGDARNGAR